VVLMLTAMVVMMTGCNDCDGLWLVGCDGCVAFDVDCDKCHV
jgi:hypothetical protein